MNNSLAEQLKQQSEALSSFKKQSPTATTGDLITGVSIPISLDYNDGKIRIYLSLNTAVLENPETLNTALDYLGEVFTLDVWQSSATASSKSFKSSKSTKRWPS